MASNDGVFSARSGYRLRLVVNEAGQSYSGNYTDVNWALYIVDTTGNGSWDFGSYPWSASISGQGWNGATGYDFRGYNTLLLGSGTRRVGHDGNGNANIGSSASFGGNSTIGTAYVEVWQTLTRIPQYPGAPLISGTVGGTPLGFSDVTPTTARVRFSFTTDGGSPINGWQLQYATDAAFTQNVVTISSSGTSDLTGLLPGTTYYARARGSNQARGWGPWSATASATTLPSLSVSDGTSWGSAQIFVSNGTAWTSYPIQYSDGTSWLNPTV
ncbi:MULTISPECIES: fibronectin type III domain-containing protein [unclassified Microbacterium]|uniref:fibronectin type III domain-containing protein n=1 Tax=unclassified Microbacterium TaxID=2609290 RepID=UPI0030193A87